MVPFRCISVISTEIPTRRSISRSVLRIASISETAIKASRRTSTREEDGLCSRWLCPKTGPRISGWFGHSRTGAERISPRVGCSRNGRVDDLLIAKNAPSDPFLSTANSNPTADNKPPIITGGASQTNITLPSAATLSVTATDDGLPKPGPGDRGGRVEGVKVRWILYRGPGKVQFDPELSPAVYGKPLTSETKVSFSEPGEYRIRAIATDGATFSTYDVDVKVNPRTSAKNAP